MKNILGSYTRFLGVLAVAVILQISLAKSAHANQCVAYEKSSHQLVQIRPGYHTVRGTLADFNPCHATVKLSMPGLFSSKIAEKPPVFIIVHGGGGLGKAETNLSAALNSAGIATLVFDAYQMNGYTREEGFTLFLTGMTNDARQRMTYKVALGAYQWLIQNQSIDSSRIFIQGLSNGGSVVSNIAGAVDPKHVRAVFPEGASPSGLGFPFNINVPVRMIYGKLDNYGGDKEDDWMFSRVAPCSFNVVFDLAPEGTSKTCSRLQNPEGIMISAESWVKELKGTGRDVEIWFYEDAAHGIMAGPIDRGVRTYGAGPTAKKTWGWTGSSGNAQKKFLNDLIKFVKSTY